MTEAESSARPPDQKASPPRPRMGWRGRAAVFAGALVVWLVLFGLRQRDRQREVRQLTEELDSETKRQGEFGKVKTQADQYRQLMQYLNRQINLIQSLLTIRESPAPILNDLGKVMNRTTDTRLTAVRIQGGQVGLAGQSRSEAASKRFMAALEQSGKFSRLQLRSEHHDKLTRTSAYAFTLDCVHSPPPPADSANTPEQSAPKAPASKGAHP